MLSLVIRRCGGCSRVISGAFGATVRAASTTSHRELANFPKTQLNFLLPKGSCSSARNFSSESMKIATYEEVKDLCNHPEKLLIDVREPHELLETGSIPTSINIPLGQVQTIFSDETSNEDFRGRFGREKPAKESQIIFMCKIGVRSGKAADAVTQMGYRNAKNYKGSWTEWAEKENLPNPQK
ncbi:rhodanese domain-containing protein CG4456 isoform X1 [Lutzomyia longipalpis]|uniref:rhodanese domain-containing protein CG4456 isoform X1 n=1 Tax=Lutzomyia longipalpis TaxID=7200 RepID=UPI0024833931|nr:rhodanese domain-containing protein CG4456 isoform X1 [Lutzomyia longipalpis]